MRILIIADNLGNNAPGIVFRNIISGMSDKIEFDIITSTMDYQTPLSFRGSVKYIYQWKIPFWRIRTLLFKIFGYYHTQKIWARKVQNLLTSEDYDVVVSLMSSTYYASILAANLYVKDRNIKHICYCVDAIPAPFPWEKDSLYSSAMKRCVRNLMKKVDVLCMTNKEMLTYQLGIINNPHIKPIVLPNPPKETSFQVLTMENITPTFVYAGKMYGVRNPDALLDGFKLFLKKHKNAKMIFVGSGQLDIYIKKKFKDIWNSIEFISYTQDLIPIYKKCIAMIDVNANVVNDIFLSSKVISYIPYNRLIISESGDGSPVRSAFKSSQTILHVHHDAEEYYNAMEFCYNNVETIDYKERLVFLEKINMDNVSNTLINEF